MHAYCCTRLRLECNIIVVGGRIQAKRLAKELPHQEYVEHLGEKLKLSIIVKKDVQAAKRQVPCSLEDEPMNHVGLLSSPPLFFLLYALLLQLCIPECWVMGCRVLE